MQNESLRQEVTKLKNLVSHLGWHCHVYRKTLAKLPNFMVTYAETEKEVLREPTAPCKDCEMDELLLQLQQMRNEMRKVCILSPLQD